MVLGYIYVMYFSVNLCGVEDSVENYQAYMISYSVVMVFESYGILFFVSISLRISMLNYAFTHILFPLCILLLDVEMYHIGRLFDRKPDKLLSRTLYTCRIRVTAHVIFKVCEEDAVNYVLFAPLSNYREGANKLTDIPNKMISHIKADSENAVLAPRKP